MGILLRLPPEVEADDLQKRMVAWCYGAHLSFPGSVPAFQGERNTPLVRALLRAIRANGGRPHFKLKTGTSDMNIVGPVWGCPIVAYGPGDSSLDHGPGEHVEIEEYQRSIQVLACALGTVAGSI